MDDRELDQRLTLITEMLVSVAKKVCPEVFKEENKTSNQTPAVKTKNAPIDPRIVKMTEARQKKRQERQNNTQPVVSESEAESDDDENDDLDDVFEYEEND